MPAASCRGARLATGAAFVFAAASAIRALLAPAEAPAPPLALRELPQGTQEAEGKPAQSSPAPAAAPGGCGCAGLTVRPNAGSWQVTAARQYGYGTTTGCNSYVTQHRDQACGGCVAARHTGVPEMEPAALAAGLANQTLIFWGDSTFRPLLEVLAELLSRAPVRARAVSPKPLRCYRPEDCCRKFRWRTPEGSSVVRACFVEAWWDVPFRLPGSGPRPYMPWGAESMLALQRWLRKRIRRLRRMVLITGPSPHYIKFGGVLSAKEAEQLLHLRANESRGFSRDAQATFLALRDEPLLAQADLLLREAPPSTFATASGLFSQKQSHLVLCNASVVRAPGNNVLNAALERVTQRACTQGALPRCTRVLGTRAPAADALAASRGMGGYNGSWGVALPFGMVTNMGTLKGPFRCNPKPGQVSYTTSRLGTVCYKSTGGPKWMDCVHDPCDNVHALSLGLAAQHLRSPAASV